MINISDYALYYGVLICFSCYYNIEHQILWTINPVREVVHDSEYIGLTRFELNLALPLNIPENFGNKLLYFHLSIKILVLVLQYVYDD